MKKIYSLIVRNINSMIDGIKLPFLLLSFYHKNTNVEYIKISTNVILSKFINMIVMFMPLKLLFVLSGSKNIEILTKLEHSIGRNNYIALVIFALVIFYLANVVLQIYKAKLVRRQLSYIEDKDYEFNTKKIPSSAITSTYAHFCQVLGDMLILIIVCFVLFIVDHFLALYYMMVVILFSLLYEQWIFSKHETRLMKRLDIDKKHFVQAMSMIMFLVIFVGLILVVISTGMSALKAILILLLMRLSNSSFKSYLSCHMKLRQHFI